MKINSIEAIDVESFILDVEDVVIDIETTTY